MKETKIYMCIEIISGSFAMIVCVLCGASLDCVPQLAEHCTSLHERCCYCDFRSDRGSLRMLNHLQTSHLLFDSTDDDDDDDNSNNSWDSGSPCRSDDGNDGQDHFHQGASDLHDTRGGGEEGQSHRDLAMDDHSGYYGGVDDGYGGVSACMYEGWQSSSEHTSASSLLAQQMHQNREIVGLTRNAMRFIFDMVLSVQQSGQVLQKEDWTAVRGRLRELEEEDAALLESVGRMNDVFIIPVSSWLQLLSEAGHHLPRPAQVVLFVDDITVGNPLRTDSAQRKYCVVLARFAVPPASQSKLPMHLPVALMPSATKKTHMFAVLDIVMANVLSDIESCADLKFSHLVADGLACFEVLGLKQSFQQGELMCSSCLSRDTRRMGPSRVFAEHLEVVEEWMTEIESGVEHGQAAAYGLLRFGLSRPSPVWTFPQVLDPVIDCVHDPMHTFFTGVFMYILNWTFRDLCSSGTFTGYEISKKLSAVKPLLVEIDRPLKALPQKRISSGTLTCSAARTFTLISVVPMALGFDVSDRLDMADNQTLWEKWHVLCVACYVGSMMLKPVFGIGDNMIEDVDQIDHLFHQLLADVKQLWPRESIPPKFHWMVFHLADDMRRFGGTRNLWAMRMEAKLGVFKFLAQRMNWKSSEKTLLRRMASLTREQLRRLSKEEQCDVAVDPKKELDGLNGKSWSEVEILGIRLRANEYVGDEESFVWRLHSVSRLSSVGSFEVALSPVLNARGDQFRMVEGDFSLTLGGYIAEGVLRTDHSQTKTLLLRRVATIARVVSVPSHNRTVVQKVAWLPWL